MVGLRRVLLPGVTIELSRDGDALGPGGLADPRMSRRHCRIDVTARDALVLHDLGSSNGTWVNGVAAGRRELDVDDVVRVGGVLLAVQRAPASYPVFAQGPAVALGWAMARVLVGLRDAPREHRLLALHGEPSTGVSDLVRCVASREGLPFTHVATAPSAPVEDHVTLVGPLSCPDESTCAALRDATPTRGRLVLWVECRARDQESDIDASLAALTPSVWRVPPLRERMVDLPLLIERSSASTHGRAARVHHRLMVSLLRSPWPGNLRQLDDFVRAHLAPTKEAEPVRWSEAMVEPLAAEAFLERSAEGDDGPRAAPCAAAYRVERDGRWFDLPDGARVQVYPRRALARLLGALARHHASGATEAVSTARLVEAGWPGEKPVGSSGAGRVYVALSTLRKLGLRDVLERLDEGYRLGGARIDVVDD